MAHAVRIHQTGGPDVLRWDSVEVGAPGPGQLRLKQHAVGVNYIDVYQRSGLYKLPLPFVAGSEGAGEVTAVGAGVSWSCPVRRGAPGRCRSQSAHGRQLTLAVEPGPSPGTVQRS